MHHHDYHDAYNAIGIPIRNDLALRQGYTISQPRHHLAERPRRLRTTKQGNTAHYDYFDYIDGNNDRQQYEPDFDMEFIEFKKLMRKEWLELQTQTYTQTHSKAWGFWC